MKYLLVGYGIQGKKRKKILKKKCVGIVDPHVSNVNYKNLNQVDENIFDNAIVSVPYHEQEKTINQLIKMKKNILVDKPLILKNIKSFKKIEKKLITNKLILKTSYNHRYEESIQLCKNYLNKKALGKIYYLKIFYGNGTSKNIKSSNWKDTRTGVRTDLIPHLLDMSMCLLKSDKFKLIFKSDICYENKKADFAKLQISHMKTNIYLEASYLSWKNKFNLEIFGSKGSIIIKNLSKWGKVSFIFFKRKFPSGKPKEIIRKFNSVDRTFYLDILDFEKKIIQKKIQNLTADKIIFKFIN